MAETLPLKAIKLDVELQPREDIDRDLVAAYAEAMVEGAEFPPVVVFRNGSAEHLLSDGWHRYYAHKALDRKQIAAEVLEGDRLAALRYSIGANAAHGRQRSEMTLRRAYQIACANELIDPASDADVVGLLKCSERAARDLTAEAKEFRKAAARSIAMQLAAQGVSQQEIAGRLGMAQKTISDWLSNSGMTAKITSADPLPPQAELEAIAAEIKAAARKEVLPEVRAELQTDLDERVAQLRATMEGELAKERERSRKAVEKMEAQVERAAAAQEKLKEKVERANRSIEEAKDKAARQAAERTKRELEQELAEERRQADTTRKELESERKRLEKDQAKRAAALKHEAEKPLAETDQEAAARADAEQRERMRRGIDKLTGPAVDAWFCVLKAIEAADAIDPEALETLSDDDFERKVLERYVSAITKLRSAFQIARERNGT